MGMSNKLLAIWDRASPAELRLGKSWYEVGHIRCRATAALLETTPATVAGVLAALSPRMQHELAYMEAVLMLAAHVEAKACGMNDMEAADAVEESGPWRSLGQSRRAAQAILAGAPPITVLRGPKVRSFYHNLTYPGESREVTVDVWAARAAGVDAARFDYRQVAWAYVVAADKRGVLPHQMQAVVWCVERKGDGWSTCPSTTDVLEAKAARENQQGLLHPQLREAH